MAFDAKAFVLIQVNDDEMPGTDSPAALKLVASVAERHGGGDTAVPTDLRELPLSDTWNGKHFAHHWRATTRYNFEKKKWVVYKKGRWSIDQTGEVDRRLLVAIEMMNRFESSTELLLGKKREALCAHYAKCLEGSRIEEMKRRAQSECPCTSDEFDTDPMLLNVANGTMELTTGTLRPARSEDMLLKQSPVTFDPEAVPTRWLPAVDLWMASDRELIRFLRRMTGLFLTGDISDEAFFMLLGPPGAGKGTYVSTIEELLGPDYVFALSVEYFLQQRNQQMAVDVAAVRGKRLVTVSENEKHARMNVAKIKQWTGGDRMSGKALYENLSNYRPTHKLLLQTNYEPRFADKTLQRRLKNLRFGNPVKDVDGKLKEHLRDNELSGILNWALGSLPGEQGVFGLADWRAHTLNTPDAVRRATTELLESQEDLRDFFNDRCQSGPEFEMDRKLAFNAYAAWCRDNNERPPSRNGFYAAMRAAAFDVGFAEKNHINGNRGSRGWLGIGLLDGVPTASGGLCELCPRKAQSDRRCAEHPRGAERNEDGLF